MGGLWNSLNILLIWLVLILRKQSRKFNISGRITRSMNATFIALIPKCSTPNSFEEFKPISLCNLVYKVGAKILANGLKHGLSEGLSKE